MRVFEAVPNDYKSDGTDFVTQLGQTNFFWLVRAGVLGHIAVAIIVGGEAISLLL
jgi:hypothetical protein